MKRVSLDLNTLMNLFLKGSCSPNQALTPLTWQLVTLLGRENVEKILKPSHIKSSEGLQKISLAICDDI